MSATEAGKKTSNEADEAFKNAVSELGDYEKKNHFKETVTKRIEMAEKADKSSLKVLNSLMEKFRVREELITLLHHSLMLIFSRRRRNRRCQSSFFSTSPFQIKIPPL
jgi:hypothetical protein